ncbi:wall-associated receptor kinase 2-like [Hordeum vulgare subsp. vulgare]|uniref:Protein kinase domain-containing protein n=1 Tax=Hordeum vulgare subsp. vulgare TaxID=112509 RepID=A0A8I6YZ53_HORVV|nr:wall-associated receptor kinase 2-like [Hordeum vulgare subsp. vulgare]
MAQITISAVAIAAAALILMPVFTFTRGSVAAAGDPMPPPPPIGLPGCVTSCGDVEVPYQFGIGKDTSCYLPGFNLTCDNNTGSGPRLLLDADGTIQVLQIQDVSSPIMLVQRNGDVKMDVDANGNGNGTFSRSLRHDGPYMFYSHSELILTGCNVQATVKSGRVILASCTSLCDDTSTTHDEGSVFDRCSGGSTGCCRADIVTRSYDDNGKVYNSSSTDTASACDVEIKRLGCWNHSCADLEQFPVRVFVADRRWFGNASISNELLQAGRPPSTETMAVPVWLQWDVVGPSLCKSNHSEVIEGLNGIRRGGYTCTCKDGYDGNPYLTDGCKDYNECKRWPQEDTGCYGECRNTEGSFTCRCPSGTTGNHSIPGGCVNTTVAVSDSCMTSCGDVKVPYPFGFGPSKCYSPGFGLACDTTHHPPQLLLGSGRFRVINISLVDTTVHVIHTTDLMLNAMFKAHGVPKILGGFPTFFDKEAPYSLSTGNELILTGCNVQATLLGHGNPAIISGCASFCSHNDTTTTSRRIGTVGWPTGGIHGGSGGGKYCYGMGCCQARISESIDGMPKELRFSWVDTTKPQYFMPLPGFVFIAKEGWFDQPGITSKLMREHGQTLTEEIEVPLLLRWEVLLLHGGSSSSSHPDCDRDQAARDLCKSEQSHCQGGTRGYSCQCNHGYHGNPYMHDGCKGGIKKPIKGLNIIIGVSSGAGLILLVLITYFISYILKHQRAQMLKGKYFEQNRGQLLQQLVSQRADIAERMIISLEELEKATNNFDKSRELGGGGHGTVYKGILSDLQVVAIKKTKMVVQREIDEFINEVAILSQINHRNVVKLYGCCLETKVPLLVYEFISNGTLYDHLHVEGPISLSWDDRLRIATETAKSLAHLHSTALVPIIHRDVKPANILLDDTLTAKVADFGASRYIPLDKSGLTTNVQGTLGYLDPMYMHTWRLTEKSDVYSFGVMLIELMTRKKPFTYMASEGNGLVAHFATLFVEGNLSEILDPQVMSEGGNRIDEITAIAVACVKLRGEERPTMRQVELRLEAVRSPVEFEANGGIVANSPLACGPGLTSRQYSMEEEYMLSARYPR